eukprot:scaffold11735_cov56-Phaeocystis_antarctica.AAC.5
MRPTGGRRSLGYLVITPSPGAAGWWSASGLPSYHPPSGAAGWWSGSVLPSYHPPSGVAGWWSASGLPGYHPLVRCGRLVVAASALWPELGRAVGIEKVDSP